MMMPANFTAVNSEVVYGGADLFSILADTTAPVWNAANVKKFNTNVITLISNSFFQKTVSNTLGVMFGGNWGKDNDHIFGEDGALNQNVFGLWDDSTPSVRTDDMTFGNKVMQSWAWLLSATPWAPPMPRSASTMAFTASTASCNQ